MSMTNRTLRLTAAIAGTALLAGCISLGQEPPDSLLSLTATAEAAAGTGASGDIANAIEVVEPDAPARLDVTRVPVQIDDTNIAYLKDALWVEKPARLFARLLGETIRATTNRLVIDGDDPALTPRVQLRGTLREFGYDARTSSVVVRYDAIRDVNGQAVTTRRFESIIPGVAPEAGPVGEALNRAANDVAGQVAGWIG